LLRVTDSSLKIIVTGKTHRRKASRT